MQVGSIVSIKTEQGICKGILSRIENTEETTSYEGYIDGRHYFEIIHVKKSDHYSGEVCWDKEKSKQLKYNASFIETFKAC